MSSTFSRRKMLFGTATVAAGALVLAGCKTVSSGTSHAIVIDVTKVEAYAKAGLNAAATINSLLSFIPAYAPYGLTIAAITTLLSADLGKFSSAAGSVSTISYDTSSVATLVDSLVNDLERLLSAIATLASTDTAGALGITPTQQNTVTTVTNALNTVVSVFQAIIGSVGAVGSGSSTMTEAEALRVLGVHA